MASIKNVVLVHGGFVDGASWGSVYKILKNGGYRVSIVQNPTISLEDDAAATQRILATQDGPAILVGHSSQRCDQRTGVEDQAELVLGGHRGSDDPSGRTTRHGQTSEFHDC